MSTSAILKIGIVGEMETQVIGFSNYDFSEFINANPSLDLDKLVSILLLEKLYIPLSGGFTPYLSGFEVQPDIPIKLGAFHNKNTLSGLGDNNSLVGFTAEFLKSLLYEQLVFMNPALEEPLIGASLDDYIKALAELGLPISIHPEKTVLRIYEFTQQELEAFGSGFVDYFQQVKSQLINDNSKLESLGYVKAKYYPSGNYIDIVSECALIEQQPQDVACLATNRQRLNSFSNPSGELYAKYRINNEEWQYYSVSEFMIGENPVLKFLDTIEYLGWKMFVNTNSLNDSNTGVFLVERLDTTANDVGGWAISGSGNKSPYNNPHQKDVVARGQYEIQFEVTTPDESDLVYRMFKDRLTTDNELVWGSYGDKVSLYSCGVGMYSY